MATHYTYKGKPVDMGAMLMINEHKVALGNANMNARGDLLGRGGQVLQTNEELVDEYYQQQASTKSVYTDEAPAVADGPVMEEFDPSLLTGYADPEPVEEAPAPKRRRKAPAAE